MLYQLKYIDRDKNETVKMKFEADTVNKARNFSAKELEGKNYTEPALYEVKDEQLSLFT